MAKSQTKITELEAAAEQAAEAVEEAKQKAEKLQGEIDKLQVRESHQKTSWTITTANVTMLDTIPHSDFWAL